MAGFPSFLNVSYVSTDAVDVGVYVDVEVDVDVGLEGEIVAFTCRLGLGFGFKLHLRLRSASFAERFRELKRLAGSSTIFLFVVSNE